MGKKTKDTRKLTIEYLDLACLGLKAMADSGSGYADIAQHALYNIRIINATLERPHEMSINFKELQDKAIRKANGLD